MNHMNHVSLLAKISSLFCLFLEYILGNTCTKQRTENKNDTNRIRILPFSLRF